MLPFENLHLFLASFCFRWTLGMWWSYQRAPEGLCALPWIFPPCHIPAFCQAALPLKSTETLPPLKSTETLPAPACGKEWWCTYAVYSGHVIFKQYIDALQDSMKDPVGVDVIKTPSPKGRGLTSSFCFMDCNSDCFFLFLSHGGVSPPTVTPEKLALWEARTFYPSWINRIFEFVLFASRRRSNVLQSLRPFRTWGNKRRNWGS